MRVIFLPLINPDDNVGFQRILNNGLPNTYDEWGDLYVREAADILGEGNEYCEVKVSPVPVGKAVRRRGYGNRSVHRSGWYSLSMRRRRRESTRMTVRAKLGISATREKNRFSSILTTSDRTRA